MPQEIVGAADAWCNEGHYQPTVYDSVDGCKSRLEDLKSAYAGCDPSPPNTPNSKRGQGNCVSIIESTFNDQSYKMILWAGLFAKSVAFRTHASTNGATACLEMTQLGHMMDHLTNEAKVLTWNDDHTAELWGVLSRVFAQKADRNSPVIAGQSAPRMASFLWTAELPELIIKEGDLRVIIEWWADHSLPENGAGDSEWPAKLQLATDFSGQDEFKNMISGESPPTVCDWEIADRKINGGLDISGVQCRNPEDGGAMSCDSFVRGYKCPKQRRNAAVDITTIDQETYPPVSDIAEMTETQKGSTSLYCKNYPDQRIEDDMNFAEFLKDTDNRVDTQGATATKECKGGAPGDPSSFKQQQLRGGLPAGGDKNLYTLLDRVNNVLEKEIGLVAENID